jgi:hypothetical protein
VSAAAPEDLLVTLDLAPEEDSLAAIASRIPDAATLEPGRRVVVPPARAARKGFLARLRTPPPVPLALRASALLVRGYVCISAAADRVTALVPRPPGA